MKTELMPVPFYGDTLVLVNEEGTPFVAMKAIVENMGLLWAAQFVKLNEKFKSSVSIIEMVAEDGRNRDMVCLPLRKLPAWLYSVSPNKVAPDLRDKIIQYQNECDDALWDYWTKGQATRPGAPLPKEINNAAWQAARLGEKLLVTTHPELRRILYAGMDRYCKMLGITTPALQALGHQALPEPLEATEFWGAYDQLTNVHHCNLNHARTRGLVAVQLHQVQEAATQHGLAIAARAALMQALRYSDSRAFKGVRTVNSAENGKSVKCWVFADH